MSNGNVIAHFNGLQLDLTRGVLERNGALVPLRPKSFALLAYFARHPDRVVSKEEIFVAVWERMVVADDALIQTVKDVRRAIGDPGGHILRTVPKRGYLFAPRPARQRADEDASAPVGASPDRTLHALARRVDESVSQRPFEAAELAERPATRVSGRNRPAIAVLPFAVEAHRVSGEDVAQTRDGLLRDIIRELSRLRGVLVIAAASVKVLDDRLPDVLTAGRLLRVDYVAAGSLSHHGEMLRLDVELVAVDDGRVLLSGRFSRPFSGAARIGSELAADVVRAVATEIDLAERNLAALRPATELDAWQAYHRGLWHMHSFKGGDNRLAARFFERSIELDPTFARPYAGLSFTHFLKAWLFDPATLTPEAAIAHDLAARAVHADPHDPSAHAALGRALWLQGAASEAVEALERSTELSPNFAFGHYATGFVEGLSGDPCKAVAAIDTARELSPFDPFIAPMHTTRAIALMRLGRLGEAGDWGSSAARQPNAHSHVLRSAVICMTAAGRVEEVAPLVEKINRESLHNGGESFVRGMRLKPPDERMFRDLGRQSGLL